MKIMSSRSLRLLLVLLPHLFMFQSVLTQANEEWDGKALHSQAIRVAKGGRLEESLKYFRAAVRKEPSRYEWLNNLGVSLASASAGEHRLLLCVANVV